MADMNVRKRMSNNDIFYDVFTLEILPFCVNYYRRVINSPLFSFFTLFQPQTNQNKWIQDIYVNSETIKTNVGNDQLTTTISRHQLTLLQTVSAIKESLDCFFVC